MLKLLRQALGKIVQGIKNFFRKKSQPQENAWVFYSGTPLSMPDFNTPEKDIPLFTINTPKEITFTIDNAQFDEELLWQKLISMPLTDLPKHYRCKTLILSVYPNSSWTGTGVDMSQYEEKGLAHFFVCRPESGEELLEEYARNFPEADIEELGDGGLSCIIPDAVLLEYEDGIWDYLL